MRLYDIILDNTNKHIQYHVLAICHSIVQADLLLYKCFTGDKMIDQHTVKI